MINSENLPLDPDCAAAPADLENPGHLPPDILAKLRALFEDGDVERLTVEAWRSGFETCLRALYEEERGKIYYEIVFGRLGLNYLQLLPKQSRAATSRVVCKLLRGLGRPVLFPWKARAGSMKGSKRKSQTANGGLS